VPGGLALSEFRGYETWQTIAISRNDSVMAVILGNPAMLDAYRAGIPANGKPLPDGARMAKIHWKPKPNQFFPDSTVPGDLVNVVLPKPKGSEMRSRNLLKALPAAVLAAVASLAPTHDANATAYAYSFDDITNLRVTSPPGAPPGGLTIINFQGNSTASATLNGVGTSTQDNTPVIEPGRASNFDTLPAVAGAAPAAASVNNTFPPLVPFPGVGPGTANWARGDAIIDTTEVNPLTFGPTGTPTRARNVAEAIVNGLNTGGASGGNDSSTRFTFVTLAPGQQIGFDFDADPLMRVATTLAGETAESSLAVVFSIRDATGLTVFEWAMNGGPGGINGGTELSDPCSLNTTLAQLAPGSTFYDPTPGTPIGTGVCGNAGGISHYSAVTNPGVLLPGVQYTLSLAMTERVDVRSVQAVPEAGTLTLLGAALAGLGFVGLRRKNLTSL